ncbi:hypothetical protein ZWY2020_009004 [Hordeum vulgare]|nr:hypothetical protein ZWY2020_009004 [Hordeum vulgare]
MMDACVPHFSPGVSADPIQKPRRHHADFSTTAESSSWASSAGQQRTGPETARVTVLPRSPARVRPCRRCQSPGAGHGSPASRVRGLAAAPDPDGESAADAANPRDERWATCWQH